MGKQKKQPKNAKKPKQPKNETIPYQGLRFFDVDDAQHFFGREALVRSLLRRLRPDREGDRPRFLGILGPSGSGKSSLARAGLLANLAAGEHEGQSGVRGSEHWPSAGILQPGSSPLNALAMTLLTKETKQPTDAEIKGQQKALRRSSTALHDFVQEAMAKRPKRHRWVLLIDQFEEVFTLCRDPKERRAFIDNLHQAVTATGGRVSLIVTLRADFYGQCALDPRLSELFAQHQLLLRPMSPEELTDAMIQPALRAGCSFESDLVETLCQEVKDSPGALPLLQCALLELWRQRKGRSLTKDAYLSFGSLEGVLERRAEETYAALTPLQQEECRRLFMALVQVGQSTEDTKRKTALPSLLEGTDEPQALLDVLGVFADHTVRLLTVEGPLPSNPKQPAPQTSVEVSHEALLAGWQRLRGWLSDHKDALHFYKKLKSAALDWQQTSEETRDAMLWNGPQLALAETWSTEHPDLLRGAPFITSFLDNAIAKRDTSEAQEQQFLKDTKHSLEDRAFLLNSKESINQKKSVYLEQQEASVKRQLRWAHAAFSAAAVLLVILTWSYVRAS